MTELLTSCPFCGETENNFVKVIAVSKTESFVRCGLCGAESKHTQTAAEAIKKWNRRNQNLLPCPFCGEKRTGFVRNVKINNTTYQVQCLECGGKSGRANTPKSAKINWNCRQDPDINSREDPGELPY